MKDKIIIGTRGSELALWQARYTQSILSAIGIESELKIIQTKGDQIQNLSFDKIEGKGFFTKEIEHALIANEIDIAVHSHKDLETQDHPELIIAAVSEREDPRDVLLIRKEKVDNTTPLHLQKNAIVGTSSVRRKVQLLNIYPDLHCADIRGNVPTRIQKLSNGDFDAIVLAAAGLIRLNIDLTAFDVQFLDARSFIPAPAQGVLAWQCRKNDQKAFQILQSIHQSQVKETLQIERSILQQLNGGCQLPLGVFCEKKEGTFFIHIAYAARITEPLLSFQHACQDTESGVAYCLNKIKQWQAYSSADNLNSQQ